MRNAPATIENFPSLSAHGLGREWFPDGTENVSTGWRPVLGGKGRASFWVYVESATSARVEYVPVGKDGQPLGEAVEQPVALSWPEHRRFGSQFAFVCPSCGQGRRALYVVERLACRECCKLYYQVQGEDVITRRARRARRIAAQLGPGLTRPERMRESTYRALLERYRLAEHDALRILADGMGSFTEARQAASQALQCGVCAGG